MPFCLAGKYYKGIDTMTTDTDRLNWLEAQNKKEFYTGRCIFRWSTTGRGWRLHESADAPGAEPTFPTVREAIDYSMKQ